MIEGCQYIETVKSYFGFLIAEYRFKLHEEKIPGNTFYDVQFKDETRIVSVSYENIEDYFQLVVFKLQNGDMPHYDNKTKTLQLNKLISTVLSKIDKREISLNNEYFAQFKAKNELERKLLKSAKELRLCLMTG
jgi:hypothetical protein